METPILIAHVLIALSLIFLVLIQQGKGADAGASFGGASQTVFGSQGSGNFFSRLTGWLALAFFITSATLALFARQNADIMKYGMQPEAIIQQQTKPGADSDIPQLKTTEKPIQQKDTKERVDSSDIPVLDSTPSSAEGARK